MKSNSLRSNYKKFKEEHDEFLTNLDFEVLRKVCKFSREIATYHGILFKSLNGQFYNHHIPFTLFPSFFPKLLFDQARQVQPLFNKLYHLVSMDEEFIINQLSGVAKDDAFIKNLLIVMRKAGRSKFSSKVDAVILRSDYMIDGRLNDEACPDDVEVSLKQVEINTISCSFGAHASHMPELHQAVITYLNSFYVHDNVKTGTSSSSTERNLYQKIKMPKNSGLLEDIAKMIHACSELYRKSFPVNNESLPRCILFITQVTERNCYDQIKIEMALKKLSTKVLSRDNEDSNYMDLRTGSYSLFFCSLDDMYNNSFMSQTDGKLLFKPYDGPNREAYEVEVVYFRAGYHPNDYTSANEWAARECIECSRAIKIPSMAMQLAGCKKIQQVLSIRSNLQKFLSDPKECDQLSKFFTVLYSLDSHDVSINQLKELLDKVKRAPDMFVLKPQREGGGFNVYGDDIIKKLQNLIIRRQNSQESVYRESSQDDFDDKERTSSVESCEYILMDMIRAPVLKNLFVQQSSLYPELENSISELGIWGFYIHDGSKEIMNKTGGYLLRTKRIQELDGGVASGRAALDSTFWF